MFNVSVYNTDGKEIEKIKLDEKVFCDIILTSTIYQTINNYRANQRKGLASTKTRGEVSGGGKKPWKQKGTGRARAGSIRSPLWRHGGVVFGPHPRDYSYELPAKIKKIALKYALSAKAKEQRIVVLDDLKVSNPKTKEVVKILTNLNLTSGKEEVLLLMGKVSDNLKKATKNISFLKVGLTNLTNTYEVVNADKILVTKDSLKELTNRVKKSL